MNTTFYHSPIGTLKICDNGSAVTYINLTDENPGAADDEPSKLGKAAVKQLREYFAGQRKAFDLPLETSGTDFQQKVWQALRSIPYGETRSYKETAEAVGSPKACRAVGMANNKNDILIVIPCHRVIGADGSLVGFGSGLDAKEYLLNLEKNFK
ncbi:MAG: methylated-DNA--[protein]-cysteine S-methyltransferase [Bacillota bacterium]|jgi:methylated-DNA-[protein]-cysteine S-methyltransferase